MQIIHHPEKKKKKRALWLYYDLLTLTNTNFATCVVSNHKVKYSVSFVNPYDYKHKIFQ